ncbi:MAG TPA: SAM-dependent methyltransferase, partial [Streptomyces sp.]|nr:SAM-dependent methyltransferase [Streptomyces sp.]
DDLDAYGIVSRLLGALPAGSALSITHITADLDPVGIGQIVDSYVKSGMPVQARSKAEVARFFDGLDLLDPGIALAHHWRPDVQVPAGQDGPVDQGLTDAEISIWAGVAVKP